MTISESFTGFNTLTLKQIFWKMKTFFKKLEYRFLVESTKIENASFPYKTAISETNVKTNRMVTTRWTYHKERSLPVTTLFSWKFCLFMNHLWCTNSLNAHIPTFCKCWSFIWRCFFPVSILNGVASIEGPALIKGNTVCARVKKHNP